MDDAPVVDGSGVGGGQGGAARVAAIFVVVASGAPLRSVPSVRAVAGVGLEGDRYATGDGHWPADVSDEVTLIATGDVREIGARVGREVPAKLLRRNLLLDSPASVGLIGRRFRIGAATFQGLRACSPCGHLEALTAIEGLRRGMRGVGGVRARVLETGDISVGAAVEVLEE